MQTPSERAAAVAALITKAVGQERRVIHGIRGHMRSFAEKAIDQALERMTLQLIQEVNAVLIDGYEIRPVELVVDKADVKDGNDVERIRRELDMES